MWRIRVWLLGEPAAALRIWHRHFHFWGPVKTIEGEVEERECWRRWTDRGWEYSQPPETDGEIADRYP